MEVDKPLSLSFVSHLGRDDIMLSCMSLKNIETKE